MLPLSEFHFAFCGIATVAATLGYACARRAVLSLASSNASSTANVEAGSPDERSLKRKLDHPDVHVSDAEEQSRPMKRNKTPPADKHSSDDDVRALPAAFHPLMPCVGPLIEIKFIQEWEVVLPPPPYEQVAGLPLSQDPVQDEKTPPKKGVPIVEQDTTSIRAPVPPAQPESSPQPEQNQGRGATPQLPQVNPPLNEPEISPARQLAVSAKIRSVNAFSAFSGSSSPFSSYSNASGPSPFALSGQNVETAPAWRCANDRRSDVFGGVSSPTALAPSPNDTTASPKTASSQSKSALAVSKEMQSITKPSTCVTGEEDETVGAELKGVKLFVKRGRKEFTDGMYGHIKVLAQKPMPPKPGNEDPVGTSIEVDSRTRLLFRRDPLGQVSMNVVLHPTVRCHFDSAENILRVILMEKVSTDGNESKEDIVVYALKPGRVQKADFQSFAKTLCDHEALKSRVDTSPTNPVSSGAAAAL